VRGVIKDFIRCLYSQDKITGPPPWVRVKPVDMPEVYEEYLEYQKKRLLVGGQGLLNSKRVINSFYQHLKKKKIKLEKVTIEQIDAFDNDRYGSLSPVTKLTYRNYLKHFLSYLYHERKILKRDLAALYVFRPEYALAKPPKFYRPEEIEKLFLSLKLTHAGDLRAYAIICLIYTMGLRPSEIRRITLDDISFSKAELVIQERKNTNPLTLPIPDETLKALAAYLIGGRPVQGKDRTLFVSFYKPYQRLSRELIAMNIKKYLLQAGLPGSIYWFRHTYAQNLMESGASIFEVQQMLGHDSIESSKKYLHVNTRLMREVLFDETV
jgi:integrase/recombinase XerD